MAGAALSSGREPQWRPARHRLALALTLGLHLLAGVWLQQLRRPVQVRTEAPRMVTILLQLPAERARRVPAPTPAPARVRVPPPQPRPSPAQRPPTLAPAQAEAPRTPPPQAAPVPPAATPPTPAPSIADPKAAPQPAPPDAATLARDPGSTAHGSFTLGLARTQVGRIDHELRGGKSGVPLEADTPWARFQRGLEAAHIDSSRSVSLDSYTSPDGVVIYREHIGDRYICRRTGSVGLGIAGARGINDAGPVDCPKGVTWKREY